MKARFSVIGVVLLLLGSCGGGGGSSTSGGASGGSGSSGGTTPSNSRPAFSSSSSFSVVENNKAVGTVEADDADSNDTLALTIEGGADADFFELGVCNASRCTSNSLSFKAAPNFEVPVDATGDNVYEVTLGAYDGTVTVTQDVAVTITNAVEGRVVDAPLSNATVCLDTNEDSECGTDEANVSSDSQGYYALAETEAQSGFELRVLSIGGTDILTNKELPSLALIAEVPADASQAVAVTPLSTVVSVATDPASVLVALGFPETVSPDEITSIDPWASATDSTDSSGEFASSASLAESIGITTTELESVADNVVTTSVQIANLIQTADAVVTDTTTAGVQSAAERAAMITSTVTKELVETIDAAVALAGSAAAASVDLGDATVTREILKETAEESASLIVAEIEAKQTAGTLDLSDTSDTTVEAILLIKEAQEVIAQTGLDSSQTANITAIAAIAADTNTLVETQVANAGVSVLTTASSAAGIAAIVTNTSTLAEQLVVGEITIDAFTTSSDVDTQAGASGGLNDAIATFTDTDGDGIFDANDAFPNDATESLDTDGDGVGDNADAFPSDATETLDSDGDGVGDNSDADTQAGASGGLNDAIATLVDTDGDGVFDANDAFPNDATESLDTDGDGVGDNADAFPLLASETRDSDSDGVGDNADAFPNDATETLDSDGDGIGDNADIFPNLPTETIDSDGDGVGDNSDLFPNDAAESSDTDGDGVGNNADIDDDSDGFSDLLEETYGSIATSSMSRLAMTQKGESLFGGETGVRSGKIALNGAGDILAIGSPGDRGATDTITQGRVQVYQYVSGAWTKLGAELSNGLADSNFGISVALNKTGDILAVGASYADGREVEGEEGQVRVYKWDGSIWSQIGSTIQASEPGTRFGKKVVLDDSGNRLVFAQNGVVVCSSTPCAYYYAQSTAYVYDWDGSNWTQKGDPLSAISASSYGVDVDVSGDGSTVAIGGGLDSNADNLKTGSVKTYRLVNDAWSSIGQTIYGDAEFDEAFYVALNKTGDVLAHGAHKNDSAGEDAGQLKVYDLVDNSWTQRGATLKGVEGDRFGGGLNLDDTGDILSVSALFAGLDDVYTYSGSVSLYMWHESLWQILGKYTGIGDNTYMFSNALSSDGGVLAVSARYEKSGELTQAGRVSVYQLSVDSDSDKVADVDDGYPSVSVGALTDFDGDGRPDICDAACQALGMSLDLDVDGDGVPDLLDVKPNDRAYYCTPPAAAIREAAPSSSSDLVFSLISNVVSVTDYLDGDESTPAHYRASMSVSNSELFADFGPMALDMDNLNAMLSGSGGKAPGLSVPIQGYPSTQSDGYTGTLQINLWEGKDYLWQQGERALSATIQLVWVANENGLILLSREGDHDLVYTSTNGTAISSKWSTDGANILVINDHGILRPASLDIKLMDFISKNIAANSPELANFFSAGDYSIQFVISGINFTTLDNQSFDKIKTTFSVAKDPIPVVYGNDLTVSEKSSTANATLSFSHSVSDTSVAYRTISNSATMGTDFTSVSGTISAADIQAVNGQSSATIQVPLLKDAALCEDSEEFSILLSSSTAAIGDPLIRVTISDDGTGSVLTDADKDGVADFADLFPSDSSETIDTDLDGIGNTADTDDDGDGVADASDAFPLDATETKDSDSDGVGDNSDPFPNDASETIDTDLDGIGNNTDTDDDGDGTLDVDDASPLDAFPLDDTISAARRIDISQWPSDFIVISELDRSDISFDPVASGTLISLNSDKTVKYHDEDDVAETGTWTVESNQLKLLNITSGTSSYRYYNSNESSGLTNIDTTAWDTKFSGGFGQQLEVQYRTDYTYWLVSQADGKYQLYKSQTQKTYLVDSSLVIDSSLPIQTGTTAYEKQTWYEYEGSQLKPFTADELTKRWAFPIDLNSSRSGSVALAYDLADFNADGTGKVVSTNRTFQWSTNQAGSIVVVFDDDTTQRVTIGRYHINGDVMGVSAKGVISDTRVVSKYHYTMPQSETDVDMSSFYGRDQLVLYTDPLYQNPVYAPSDYFGYIFNADGTMRNYLSVSEQTIGGGDNYMYTNDGWYFRDYTWSRTANFLAASGCRLLDYDNDGVGEHCQYAWWRDFQLLGVAGDWLVMSLRLFNHYATVDGKTTGDLTLTGDDRTLVSSYNFILRAFDNTDVDGDEVKNIYDAHPFDATRH